MVGESIGEAFRNASASCVEELLVWKSAQTAHQEVPRSALVVASAHFNSFVQTAHAAELVLSASSARRQLCSSSAAMSNAPPNRANHGASFSRNGSADAFAVSDRSR